MKNILILKNDRIGDLFVSLKAINLIFNKHINDNIEIILSPINKKFSFLFKKKIFYVYNYRLSILEKIKIFFLIYSKNYSDVYILSPKKFYFYLPLFFKNIKFHAICIKEKFKQRPGNFLKSKLATSVLRDRTNNLNIIPNQDLHQKVVNFNSHIVNNLINKEPNISAILSNYIDKDYLIIQYKKSAFERLGWNMSNFSILLDKLSSIDKNIYLISDYNLNENIFFLNKYNGYNFKKNFFFNNSNNSKIFYFHDIDGEDLFNLIKYAKLSIVPEGMNAHMSVFNKIPILALCSFTIFSRDDFFHILRSNREWVPRRYYNKFTLIKKDVNETYKKIIRNLP